MTPDLVIQAALRSAKTLEARSRISTIWFAGEYAEPGYSTDKGIFLGNWNNVTKWNEETQANEIVDNTPKRLGDILEAMGFELEWSDEWTSCESCGAIVRIHPDGYGWQPSYADGICLECLDPEEHLQECEGPRKGNAISRFSPGDHGYLLIKDRFERGFHHRMDADPNRISQLLDAVGAKRYLFNKDDQLQFNHVFSVWLHEEEEHLLEAAKEALETGRTDGPSIAEATKRGLQEANHQATLLRKEHKDGPIISTISDGIVTTRLIVPK